MDLSLNEVQTMLQTSARDLMEAEMPRLRVLEIDQSSSGFDAQIWAQIAGLGWAGMAIPEQYGGSGNSLTDVGVVFEVLGQYACPSPLHSSAVLSALTILEAGSDSQRESLLPSIASGDQIYAFAVTEPDYGWGPDSLQMKATRLASGGYALSGTKLFVPDANVANRMLVIARTSDAGASAEGLSLFAVDSNAPGLSVRVQTGWLGPKLCEVTFDNVQVPASDLFGDEGGAWPTTERALDKATAVLCAYMAGGTRKVFEMSQEYSQTRIAFGVPIGTFQRVQDHVIDAVTDADASKWTCYEALWQLDEGRPDAPIGVSTAKAVVSDAFPRACEGSHHVHAGIGTDLEFGLTQYTMRARTLQNYMGDAIFHKRRMAQIMTAE